MEQTNKDLLEMIDRPAFGVRDGIIVYCNQTAKHRMIKENSSVWTMLPEGCDAYKNFQGDVLYLTLMWGEFRFGATVIKKESFDLFLLDRDFDETQLQILALAAIQLRTPLTNAMTVMDALNDSLDESQKEKSALLSRSLYQLLHQVSNMADAERYVSADGGDMEKTEVRSFFREVMERAAVSLSDTGVAIQYTGPEKQAFTMLDRERMERAVYNLLSNAVKFSPKGSCVQVTLARYGDQMRLTVADQGIGIPPHIQNSLFHRYLREPAIEECRYGLGLGMALVRSVAARHSGTVLLEQNCGTRVTLSFAIRNFVPWELRSPMLRLSDYLGGLDHTLVEFSDILPLSAYQKED